MTLYDMTLWESILANLFFYGVGLVFIYNILMFPKIFLRSIILEKKNYSQWFCTSSTDFKTLVKWHLDVSCSIPFVINLVADQN